MSEIVRELVGAFHIVNITDKKSKRIISYVYTQKEDADALTVNALNKIEPNEIIRFKLIYSITKSELEICLKFRDIPLSVKGLTLESTIIEAEMIVAGIFQNPDFLFKPIKQENK